MSWKSLVSAGLLCVLASPAFAVPQLEVVSGGLNAARQLGLECADRADRGRYADGRRTGIR